MSALGIIEFPVKMELVSSADSKQGKVKFDAFLKMKDKVGGKWWLKGEEHNDQLIEFVNTWLKDWVGYVEETVFDVNMLSIDQNTIISASFRQSSTVP